MEESLPQTGTNLPTEVLKLSISIPIEECLTSYANHACKVMMNT
jgi:hypothetical protein